MRRVRRSSVLWVVSLVIAGLALGGVLSSASASPPGPAQLSFACALKSNGLMRYVTSASECKKTETAVTISPGPTLVCVQPSGSSFYVTNFKSCKPSALKLTLPSSSAPVFFCATVSTGVLRYVTSPSQCTTSESAVEVPSPAPVLSNIETTALAYQAQSPAVEVTSTLTVSSTTTSLTGATVSITSGFSAANDSLSFTNQNGITGSYDASTGALTLTGAASVADYQAALRSVEFSTSDSSASPAARAVSFTVTDSASETSNTVQRTINVSAAPQAPVLAKIETTSLPSYGGAPPAAVTSTMTVSSHTTTLEGATVTISSGFVASEDSLGFTNQNGIIGSYDASTGVLFLTGLASVPNYQSALRSVTYSDSNAASPNTGDRVVSFQVDDGLSSNNLSNLASRTVTVAANTAPTCSDASASTDKNTATNITVLSGCSDLDGDALSLPTVNTTGTKGLVTLNPDGTIHYDPNGQFNSLLQGQTATDSFTYTVSDGFQSSAAATVTVTISGVNDSPLVMNIETAPLSYTAGNPAVPVTSTLTVSSPDTTTLAGATVTISSGLVATEDSLSFTNQNGIIGSYNPATGVLTLTGTASIADYQTALRSVTYRDSMTGSPNTGNRVVSFQVDDGLSSNNLSNVASRTIESAG